MKKSKAVAVSLTAVVAVTGLLAGTYAWQSISQRALNQVREVGNPGGRLHDDFNFYDDGDKNVYVENFTSGNDAREIYARIRLDEYLEIGPNAGISGRSDRGITVIKDTGALTTPELENMDTWTTYLWDREKKIEAGTTVNLSDETSEFRKYILWNQDENGNYKTDGVTNYMPTFNKNKDSKESEINGTLEGMGGVPYADRILYSYDAANLTDPTKTSIETNFAVYDADMDDVDELALLPSGVELETFLKELTNTAGNDWDTAKLLNGGTPLTKISVSGTDYEIYVTTDDDTNPTAVECVEINLDGTTDGDYAIRIVKETHTAAQTLANGDIISMSQWLSPSGKNGAPGDFWVYDEDGWVYWANPIEPEEVTSLLLDKIELRADAGLREEYYYAINVVAQFASKDQWGDCTTATTVTTNGSGGVTVNKGDGTGFYSTVNGGMTANATKLLSAAAGLGTVNYSVQVSDSLGTTGQLDVAQGGSVLLNAVVTDFSGNSVSNPAITWSVQADTDSKTRSIAELSEDTGFSKETGATTTLKIGADETAARLIVTATQKDASGEYGIGKFLINVEEYSAAAKKQEIRNYKKAIQGEDLATAENIVEIDGKNWWVLYKDDSTNRALLFAAREIDIEFDTEINPHQFKAGFGASNRWKDSYIRAYLNDFKADEEHDYTQNGFLNQNAQISELAMQTNLTTREQINTENWDTTQDKVFLLSEADVYGTFNRATADEKDYTAGVQLLQTIEQRKSPRAATSALRSPYYSQSQIACIQGKGGLTATGYDNIRIAMRPAFWVDLTSVEASE